MCKSFSIGWQVQVGDAIDDHCIAVKAGYRLFASIARLGDCRYQSRKVNAGGKPLWLITFADMQERRVYIAAMQYVANHGAGCLTHNGIMAAIDITNHADHPYNIRRC